MDYYPADADHDDQTPPPAGYAVAGPTIPGVGRQVVAVSTLAWPPPADELPF